MNRESNKTFILIIIGILWMILPFAVFNIKNKLNDFNANLKEIIRLLKESKDNF